MTTDQLIARKKKLASAARSLITGEVGLVTATLHIRRAIASLGPQAPKTFEVFDQFYKAIPGDVPLGIARLKWSLEPLIKSDSRLAEVEIEYMPALLRASAELVKTYG